MRLKRGVGVHHSEVAVLFPVIGRGPARGGGHLTQHVTHQLGAKEAKTRELRGLSIGSTLGTPSFHGYMDARMERPWGPPWSTQYRSYTLHLVTLCYT